MSISSRRWIKWIPETLSEPTDTIVLTSPGNIFVDIRVIVGTDEVADAALKKSEAELIKISANQSGVQAADELRPHEAYGRGEFAASWDRLEWAFAGTAEDLSQDAKGTRRAWTRWVDSTVEDAMGIKDEGLMTRYKGGKTEEELDLETGSMFNPATGKTQDYEELWAAVPVEPAGHPALKLCMVMVARHGKGGTPMGAAIRLGKFCQGVLRVGSKFAAERWLWHDSDRAWKRVVRIGEGEIPCNLLCHEGAELAVGYELKPAEGGFLWQVEEVNKI